MNNLLIRYIGPRATDRFKRDEDANYTLVEIRWHPDAKFSGTAHVELDRFETKNKFHAVKELTVALPHTFASFDVIGLIDDDVIPDDRVGSSWNNIFGSFSRHERIIAMPGVATAPGTQRACIVTRAIPGLQYHTVGWMDCLAPFMTRKAFFDCLPAFDWNTGVGSNEERLWAHYARTHGSCISVLDETPILHFNDPRDFWLKREGLEDAELQVRHDKSRIDIDAFLKEFKLPDITYEIIDRAPRRYDVIFYDTIGGTFDGSGKNADGSGAGGSEWSTIKTAREFSARGLTVLCLTNGGSAGRWDGVEYGNAKDVEEGGEIDCEVLICQRCTNPPPRGCAQYIVYTMHDIHHEMFENVDCLVEDEAVDAVVFVSEWQKQKYIDGGGAGYRDIGKVIYPILPIPVSVSATPKVNGRFLFIAAAMKGLVETVDAWGDTLTQMEREGKDVSSLELRLCMPNYDAGESVINAVLRTRGVRLARHRFDLQAELTAAEGVFYVNTYAECFPLSLTMAEAAGCRVHVLAEDHLAGIQEAVRGPFKTTNAKTFKSDFTAALTPKRRGSYVYASAPIKGLQATIALWQEISLLSETLVLALPNEDDVDVREMIRDILNIRVAPPGFSLVQEIAAAEGLFYVNVFPETFGLVVALAEALGTRPHILAEHGFSGIAESGSRELIDTELLTMSRSVFIRNFRQARDGFVYPTENRVARDLSARRMGEDWMKLFDELGCLFGEKGE
jgi:hypothetical protein